MITQEQYAEYRARYDRMHAFVKAYIAAHGNGIPRDAYPADCVISNDEISAIEIYEFTTDKPESYFGYIKLNDDPTKPGKGLITTFTGDTLGNITDLNYRSMAMYTPTSGFYRLRTFTMIGINGLRYHGRFYPNSGDYCKLRAYKNQ